jgi:hypothetical protein
MPTHFSGTKIDINITYVWHYLELHFYIIPLYTIDTQQDRCTPRTLSCLCNTFRYSWAMSFVQGVYRHFPVLSYYHTSLSLSLDQLSGQLTLGEQQVRP